MTFLIEKKTKLILLKNYVKFTKKKYKKTHNKTILFIFIFKNKVLKSYKNSKCIVLSWQSEW